MSYHRRGVMPREDQLMRQPPSNEDDNTALYREWVAEQTVVGHQFNPAKYGGESPRRFEWLVESEHFPVGFQRPQAQYLAAWRVLVRCLFQSLPSTLEVSQLPWRLFPVLPGEQAEPCRGPIGRSLGSCRRVVFSELTDDERRRPCGNWLMVAYVWSDDRDWVEGADVRRLISRDTYFRITASQLRDENWVDGSRVSPCHRRKRTARLWRYEWWETFYQATYRWDAETETWAVRRNVPEPGVDIDRWPFDLADRTTNTRHRIAALLQERQS
ncbi:efa6b71e-b33f-4783-b0f6-6da7271c2635 [Thermothielavioides terrestris]|uniref:Efa6b71e-b33f-4783-b0f6-6da7271c2635 n=1 Tax=Thermothielavioides terrestris TaxID=2587410 RepID=A0A3S4AQE6_9PEZI|nr:efa6b71e-b33f-4783-b0f6-6da7271c2635 [Thermothielavioides terrestris]